MRGNEGKRKWARKGLQLNVVLSFMRSVPLAAACKGAANDHQRNMHIVFAIELSIFANKKENEMQNRLSKEHADLKTLWKCFTIKTNTGKVHDLHDCGFMQWTQSKLESLNWGGVEKVCKLEANYQHIHCRTRERQTSRSLSGSRHSFLGMFALVRVRPCLKFLLSEAASPQQGLNCSKPHGADPNC